MKFNFQNTGSGSTGYAHLVEFLRQQANDNAGGFVNQHAARSVVSLESSNLDIGQQTEMRLALENLETKLKGYGAEVNADSAFTSTVALEAATATALLSAHPQAMLGRQFSVTQTANVIPVSNLNRYEDAVTDYPTEYRRALEAFDERTNKDMSFYSIAYNMVAARQSEFAEAFYRTIVVPPDQVGFSLAVQLIQVAPDVHHDITAKILDFKRRNIIDAMIDPTILDNDSTRAIPAVRDENKQYFIDSTLYTPVATKVKGVSCLTAPLLFNTDVNLLALSMTDELLKAGVFGIGDTLDVREVLSAIYLKVNSGTTNELIRFSTENLSRSEFNYAPQGNYRLNVLNFSTNVLSINVNTKTVAGALSSILAPIAAQNVDVRLRVTVSGQSNLESSTTQLLVGGVVIDAMYDSNGTLMDEAGTAYQNIKALFNGASWAGWEVNARRANLNKRQRGLLVNIDHINYIYQVPLRAPVTMPRPMTGNNAGDASDLNALIQATNLQTTNAAIAELIKVDGILASYANNKMSVGSTVDILGAGSRFVQPTYYADAVDAAADIDSIKTADRITDLQALLVNKIRDLASRMYTLSGYKAALEQLRGPGVKPCVIIGTDPYIARYLNITGDMRLLGDQFTVRVVETVNKDVRGKIWVTFGVMDSTAEGIPNVLQFGHCAWKPELTMIVDMPRDGGVQKELSVSPSFAHITNLPILSRIDVTNIDTVVAAKVTINVSK